MLPIKTMDSDNQTVMTPDAPNDDDVRVGCSGAGCKFDSNMTQGHMLHHIRRSIPTKIKYAQMDLMPTRADFLDPGTKAAFAGQVRGHKPILFMPTDILEKGEWSDGAMKYKIFMYGVLPCGSKTLVIIDDVEVHLDIAVPIGMTPSEYDKILRGQFMGKNLAFTLIANIQLFRLKEFQKDKYPHKRIYFNNLTDRKKAIDFIVAMNKQLLSNNKPLIDTASDDTGMGNYYFPKVAREFKFNTADWNRIEVYTEINAATTTNCAYAFRVSVKNFVPLPEERRRALTAAGPLSKIIDRDPTMTAQWDIETHSSIQNGTVPTPTDEYSIFNICSAYFWHWSDKPLIEVCAIENTAIAREGIGLVIECKDEAEVLCAHMDALGKMSPDILAAFNGGAFDWPLYREKLRRNGLLVRLKSKLSSIPVNTNGKWADTEESVLRWSFRKERIKIDAENTHDLDCVASFPGLLDTDVSPVFLKMYPRAEIRKAAGLNYYLARNGLEAKEDMPYKHMFRIYERSVLLAKIKSCHCGEPCACCTERVRDLDYKQLPGHTSMETVDYSDDLHDDLVDDDGNEKCCYCGKKPRNEQDMADVGYYCVIDCIRPQQLYVKRSIVPDKRELSNMSYVSLSDSFYRADGMKVRNLIGSYCYDRGMAFSNSRGYLGDSDKDHYPGAWVFPPNRGLHSDGFVDVEVMGPNGERVKKRMRCRPITGLDFASLYPSIMMTNNSSPDMVVYTQEAADKLTNEGYTLRKINPFDFERGAKKGAAGNKHLTKEGWTVRHNGIINPEDKKIVSEYVKHEIFEYKADGVDANVKYPVKAGPTAEQRATLDQLRADGVKTTRKVSYDPEFGRDALPGERMGIFPFIVKRLFDMRVPIKREFVRLEELREQMKKNKATSIEVTQNGITKVITFDEVMFDINKVNAKQKALKVLANTFYGESGNYRSSIYELLVAAGITCAGQEYIKKAALFVTNLGYTVHYGDSVTADTPILCKWADGTIGYRNIDQLGTQWDLYGDKEASACEVSTWTEQGWTKVNRVIRHYTDKNIYRVLTHTGCVDVTSDHSLLDNNAQKIKPTDVVVGAKLLHANLPTRQIMGCIDPLEAFSMGFFWADGSCGSYNYSNGTKYSWAINNQDLGYLNRAKTELDLVYGGAGMTFKILPRASLGVYKLIPICATKGVIRDLVIRYRKMFYTANNTSKAYKSVPDEILNADREVKELFVEGYYAGDGDKDAHGYFRADCRGKIGSAGLYHLFAEMGRSVSINTRADKPDVFRMTGTMGIPRKDQSAVKKIINMGSTPQYVYDLETENHHFGAGIGRMIVHNTDSVYITCPDSLFEVCDGEHETALAALCIEFEGVNNVPEPVTEREIEFKRRRIDIRVKWWTEQVSITMKSMDDLKEKVSDFFLEDTGTRFLNMAYEEVLYPGVMTGKKKYYGNDHLKTINFDKKLEEHFIKGIDVVKQGQAEITKQLGFEFMLESILPDNERELIDLAEDKIRKFYRLDPDPSLFALIGRYKPDKQNVPVKTFVARMKDMVRKHTDASSAALYEPPDAGDKFEYVIVKKDLRYTLQGNKIDIKKGDQMEFMRVYKASQETSNPMEIDLSYYMKHAIVGLFARFIAYHPRFQPPEGMYDTEDKDQYKQLDIYCIKEAGKYLESICDNITGFDKSAINQQGRDYRAIYTRANKRIQGDLVTRYGSMSYVLGLNIHNEDNDTRALSTRIIEQMKDYAKDMSSKTTAGRDFLKFNAAGANTSVFKLGKIFNGGRGTGISKLRVQMCNRGESMIIEKLYTVVPKLAKIAYKYERNIIRLIDDMRKVKFVDDIVLCDEELEDLNSFNQADLNDIKTVYELMVNLVSTYNVRADVLDIVNAIELEKAKRINEPIDPVINVREVSRSIAKTAEIIPEFVWM